MLFQQIGQLLQEPLARRRHHFPPTGMVERRFCCLHGCVNISARRLRHSRDLLAGRRIMESECTAAGGVAKLAVDQHASLHLG